MRVLGHGGHAGPEALVCNALHAQLLLGHTKPAEHGRVARMPLKHLPQVLGHPLPFVFVSELEGALELLLLVQLLPFAEVAHQAPYFSSRTACARASDMSSLPGTTPRSPPRHAVSPNSSAEGRAQGDAMSAGTWCQECSQ